MPDNSSRIDEFTVGTKVVLSDENRFLFRYIASNSVGTVIENDTSIHRPVRVQWESTTRWHNLNELTPLKLHKLIPFKTGDWTFTDVELNNKKTMDMVSAYKLAQKSEPEKTFTKAGLMMEDGRLTAEGRTLFEAFLLKECGAKFKTDVVDPILAEVEKEKE